MADPTWIENDERNPVPVKVVGEAPDANEVINVLTKVNATTGNPVQVIETYEDGRTVTTNYTYQEVSG